MTPREYADIKRFYKLAIAYDSFAEVSKSCKYAIDIGIQSLDPGYYAIGVGIVTLYCRPFTDNGKIGKLSDKKVPREFKYLHSQLIELRNKAFFHSEAAGTMEGHGKMTEVRISFDGRYLTSFSTRPAFEPSLLPQIGSLSDVLAGDVKREFDSLFEKMTEAVVPRFGPKDVGKEFELNLEDENGPTIKKATDLIENKYPVIRQLPESGA